MTRDSDSFVWSEAPKFSFLTSPLRFWIPKLCINYLLSTSVSLVQRHLSGSSWGQAEVTFLPSPVHASTHGLRWAYSHHPWFRPPISNQPLIRLSFAFWTCLPLLHVLHSDSFYPALVCSISLKNVCCNPLSRLHHPWWAQPYLRSCILTPSFYRWGC